MATTTTREIIRLVNPERSGLALFVIRNGGNVRYAGNHVTPVGGTEWTSGNFAYDTEETAASVVASTVHALTAAGLYVARRAGTSLEDLSDSDGHTDVVAHIVCSLGNERLHVSLEDTNGTYRFRAYLEGSTGPDVIRVFRTNSDRDQFTERYLSSKRADGWTVN